MSKSIADELTKLGLGRVDAPPPSDDRHLAAQKLEICIRRGRRLNHHDLNFLADACASLNYRLPSGLEIGHLEQSINGWKAAAAKDPKSTTYIGRLSVFQRHDAVAEVFLQTLANHVALYWDGQTRPSKWTRFAQKIISRSDHFGARVKRAFSPFRIEKERRIEEIRLLERQREEGQALSARRLELVRMALIDELEAHVEQISKSAPSVFSASPTPVQSDFALCACWSNHAASADAVVNYEKLKTIASGIFTANLLVSARLAERVAADFYRSLGCAVEDTSLGQLERQDKRWISHDLEVDGEAIDVKNARRSRGNPAAYSEWSISKYKQQLRMGRLWDVRLVALLSDYVPQDSPIDAFQQTEVVLLGEMTLSQMRKIGAWAYSETASALELMDPQGERFLAGWCFELPDSFYRASRRSTERIGEVTNQLVDSGYDRNRLPAVLRLLIETDGANDSTDLVRLRSLRDSVGFSRPAAVAYALVELVSAVRGQFVDLPNISEALFPKNRYGRLSTYPLLKYDPEQYVASMVDTIELVWAHARNMVSKFNRFRLTASGVFQGSVSGDRWVTILAYCGGWIQHPIRAKCGTAPLVMGVDQTCPSCLRLACHRCGYCGATCIESARRQSNLHSADHDLDRD